MNKLYAFFSRRLWWLALVALIVMILNQLLGRIVWQLELFSHYVPHMAILLWLAGIFYPKMDANKTIKKLPFRPLRALFLILGVASIVWSLQPLSLITDKTAISELSNTSAKPMTIYYQNVNVNNKQSQALVNKLMPTSKSAIANADIIALVEAGGATWRAPLAELTHHYPTHCGVNEASPFAMQVYAKEVGARCEIIPLAEFALAKLTLADPNNQQTTRIIYVAHPPPPISQYMAEARNDYLSELARLIKADSEHSVMVMGDFNLSAFSPIYRDFMRDSGHPRTNTSLQRTTVAGLPTWLPFGIGIDHILINSGANSEEAHANIQPQGWQGSDHQGFRIEWY